MTSAQCWFFIDDVRATQMHQINYLCHECDDIRFDITLISCLVLTPKWISPLLFGWLLMICNCLQWPFSIVNGNLFRRYYWIKQVRFYLSECFMKTQTSYRAPCCANLWVLSLHEICYVHRNHFTLYKIYPPN